MKTLLMNRNTWSKGTAAVSFEVLASGFIALTIELPTVASVFVNVSRRGRFAGFAPNIGTSGISSLDAVPTN